MAGSTWCRKHAQAKNSTGAERDTLGGALHRVAPLALPRCELTIHSETPMDLESKNCKNSHILTDCSDTSSSVR